MLMRAGPSDVMTPTQRLHLLQNLLHAGFVCCESRPAPSRSFQQALDGVSGEFRVRFRNGSSLYLSSVVI